MNIYLLIQILYLPDKKGVVLYIEIVTPSKALSQRETEALKKAVRRYKEFVEL